MSVTKLHHNDLLEFCIELPILLRSQIPIRKALEHLAIRTENINCRLMCEYLISEMKNGSTLASAMRLFESFLPPSFIPGLEAGENQARLEDVLELQAKRLKNNPIIDNALPENIVFNFIKKLSPILQHHEANPRAHLVAVVEQRQLIRLEWFQLKSCGSLETTDSISIDDKIENLFNDFLNQRPTGYQLLSWQNYQIHSFKFSTKQILEIQKNHTTQEPYQNHVVKYASQVLKNLQNNGLHIALCTNRNEIDSLLKNCHSTDRPVLHAASISETCYSSLMNPSMWKLQDFLMRIGQVQILLDNKQSVYLLLDQKNFYNQLHQILDLGYMGTNVLLSLQSLQIWEILPELCTHCRKKSKLHKDILIQSGMRSNTQTFCSSGCKQCRHKGSQGWIQFAGQIKLDSNFIFQVLSNLSEADLINKLIKDIHKSKIDAVRTGLIDPRWLLHNSTQNL